MKVHMIGNTHFDPVWLWTWDDAMASIRATFRSALERMNEEPDFIYSFATPPVFEWIKKTAPDMFAEIRKRAEEGRWDMCEAWWLQPDCNTPSGESLVRQGLYGQRYLRDNFGKYSDSVFNIDSFGHSLMMPQIMKKCGIDNYVFSRGIFTSPKINDNELFVWRSPDGSEVYAYKAGGIYMADVNERIRQGLESEYPDISVYGVSDHGGAPTKAAVADIKKYPKDKVCFSTLSQYFKEHGSEAKNTYDGEIQVDFYGPYANSNYSDVKKLNRYSEYAVLNAEKASAAANLLLGSEYPKSEIEDIWKDILFNQFHDILGGTCTKESYFDIRNQHGRAIHNADEIMHTMLNKVTNKIKMPGSNSENPWNAVIWNLNASDCRTPVEVEMQWVWEHNWYGDGFTVKDESDNEYPCQVIREYSVIPRFRSRIVFEADIPAMGYKTFRLIQNNEKVSYIEKPAPDPMLIETDSVILKISPVHGGIEYAYDKKAQRRFIVNSMIPVCLEDKGDTWAFNTCKLGEVLEPFKFKSAAVIEHGKVRTTVKTRSVFRNSYIDQYFTVYNDETFIDCRYRVNWDEKSTLLKLAVTPSLNDERSISDGKLSVSVPYGYAVRGMNGMEQPMGEWIDYSNGSNGLSVFADNIFSYDAKNGSINLTVLRSVIYGDLRMGELDPEADFDYFELGVKEGKMRIFPHTGSFAEAKIPEQSAVYINPPSAVVEANHTGTLPSQMQLIKNSSEHTMITVVKPACDHEGTVLRMYEYAGERDNIAVNFNGKDLKTEMNPYEIKTFAENETGFIEVSMLEE